MQPHKATIYVYANSEEEVREFERTYHSFVNEKREQGIAVSARKLTSALKQFANNFLVAKFLK